MGRRGRDDGVGRRGEMMEWGGGRDDGAGRRGRDDGARRRGEMME